MWLWDDAMRRVGFRRRSECYWRCDRRYGLSADSHVSVFSWSEQAIPGPDARPGRYLVELTEFHVTFVVGRDHIHFYYHEHGDNEWRPAGHTSPRELRRLGLRPAEVRARADAIAAQLVAELDGALRARRR
jgi:hypothetical protein